MTNFTTQSKSISIISSFILYYLPACYPKDLRVDPFGLRQLSNSIRTSNPEGPWTPGGKLFDQDEAQLLLDLAKYLAVYGAPLYRVEHRFKQAAEALEIPVSIFALPRNVMINIGDGGAKHPSRAVFIDVIPDFDMWKLNQVHPF